MARTGVGQAPFWKPCRRAEMRLMMRDLEKKSSPPDHVVYDLAGQGSQGRKDVRMNSLLSLNEILVSLKNNRSRMEVLGGPENEYAVETTIIVGEREWIFSSAVKRNGKEITDDIKLIRDELRRKRSTQANKSKALWSLFLKEAAENHLEKCSEVKRLLERSGKKHISAKRVLFIALGSVLILSAGIGLYLLYLTPARDRPEPSHSVRPAAKLQHPSAPSSPSGVSPSQPPDQPEPSPPAAPAARMPDHLEPPAIPPRRAPDLSPKEIREKVSKVLKNN
jgi:hypothetical protein